MVRISDIPPLSAALLAGTNETATLSTVRVSLSSLPTSHCDPMSMMTSKIKDNVCCGPEEYYAVVIDLLK